MSPSTTIPPKHRYVAAIVIVLAIAVTQACSSSGSDATKTTVTSTTRPAATTTQTPTSKPVTTTQLPFDIRVAAMSETAFAALFPGSDPGVRRINDVASRVLIDWCGSSDAVAEDGAQPGVEGFASDQPTAGYITFEVVSYPRAADATAAVEAAKPPAGCTQGNYAPLGSRGQDDELVGDLSTLPIGAPPESFAVEFSEANGLGRGVDAFFAHGRLLLHVRASAPTAEVARSNFQKLADPALKLLLANG